MTCQNQHFQSCLLTTYMLLFDQINLSRVFSVLELTPEAQTAWPKKFMNKPTDKYSTLLNMHVQDNYSQPLNFAQ